MNNSPTTETKACEHCLGVFTFEPVEIFGKRVFEPRFCDQCADVLASAHEESIREAIPSREDLWAEFCPPTYRDTDPSRVDFRLLRAASAWDVSGSLGLGFVGPAGVGKTRCGYIALRRAFMSGMHCYAVSSTRLAALAREQFEQDSKLVAKAILRRCCSSRVLLLDDLGKGVATERAEETLWQLLEYRTSHGLPTIWTTNAGADALTATFSADRGPAIVRRLVEFSKIIEVPHAMPKNP